MAHMCRWMWVLMSFSLSSSGIILTEGSLLCFVSASGLSVQVFGRVLDDKLDKFCATSEIGSLCECLCLVLNEELHGFRALFVAILIVPILSRILDLGDFLRDRRLPLWRTEFVLFFLWSLRSKRLHECPVMGSLNTNNPSAQSSSVSCKCKVSRNWKLSFCWTRTGSF